MCAVRISDLTVEKMFTRKKKQDLYVKICDSFIRTDYDTLTVDYERDRVLWNIDLSSSLGGGEVKAFEGGCLQEFAASMLEIGREKVSFNTENECFVKVFERFSGYGYQIKASLGCVRVCIQGSLVRSNVSTILAVITILKGSAAPILQFVKSNDSITILIEERYLSTILQALSKKFKVAERLFV
ncbi:MAG: hypothetical protein LLG02_05800 [Pelosinus sp.]|nr:hypothetical protein [Pelosinus sp.]